ncbi:hypothetical protein Tco_1291432, partial [Tanacetum coccineum]
NTGAGTVTVDQSTSAQKLEKLNSWGFDIIALEGAVEAVLQKLKLHLSSLCFSVNVGAAGKVTGNEVRSGYEYYGSRGRGVRQGIKRDRVTRDLPTPTQSPRSMSPVANSSRVVDAN